MNQQKRISRERFLQLAMDYLLSEQTQRLSARGLAEFGGFSTQKIYYEFETLDQLWEYLILQLINQFDHCLAVNKPVKLADINLLLLTQKQTAAAFFKILQSEYASLKTVIEHQLHKLCVKYLGQYFALNFLHYNWVFLASLHGLIKSKQIEFTPAQLQYLVDGQIKLISKIHTIEPKRPSSSNWQVVFNFKSEQKRRFS